MNIIMKAIFGLTCASYGCVHTSEDKGHAALQAFITKLNNADKEKKEQQALQRDRQATKADNEQMTFYNQATTKQRIKAKL